jgi:hypothetical protein
MRHNDEKIAVTSVCGRPSSTARRVVVVVMMDLLTSSISDANAAAVCATVKEFAMCDLAFKVNE